MSRNLMDEIKSMSESEEAQRAARSLVDNFASFCDEVAEKGIDASFLLMLEESIVQDVTFREVLEKYYVELTDSTQMPTTYENGLIKHVNEGLRYEVGWGLRKRKTPKRLSDAEYDKIAIETIDYLCKKLGKDLYVNEKK